jgi:outer membrane biosynthesis protein TonB
MSDSDQTGSLKSCLEESNNPRMQNYVKILDTPGISAMEWIHRTQEELMDGIVYLEKLKNVFSMNMRELDAAAKMVAQSKEEKKNETENIDISAPPPEPVPPTSEELPTAPKKKVTKSKTEKGEASKEEKPKKRKTKVVAKEEN